MTTNETEFSNSDSDGKLGAVPKNAAAEQYCIEDAIKATGKKCPNFSFKI